MSDISTAIGVNSTKRAAIIAGTAGVGSFNDGANEWGTKLRAMYDTYTVPSGDTLHSDAVLTMGTLPKGARVFGWYFGQDGGAEAAVATAKIATVAASASAAFTDMSSETRQFVPALVTFSSTPLTVASAVTLDFATEDVDAATVLVLVTFYILED